MSSRKIRPATKLRFPFSTIALALILSLRRQPRTLTFSAHLSNGVQRIDGCGCNVPNEVANTRKSSIHCTNTQVLHFLKQIWSEEHVAQSGKEDGNRPSNCFGTYTKKHSKKHEGLSSTDPHNINTALRRNTDDLLTGTDDLPEGFVA